MGYSNESRNTERSDDSINYSLTTQEERWIEESTLLMNFLESADGSAPIKFTKKTLDYVRRACISRIKVIGELAK